MTFGLTGRPLEKRVLVMKVNNAIVDLFHQEMQSKQC